MTLTVDLQDELYRKFQAALILNDEDEISVVERLLNEYIKRSFLKEVVTETERINTAVRDQVQATMYSEKNKAVSRIHLWARRPEQFNHRILQSYFVCEKENCSSKNSMRQYFVKSGYGTEWQFDNNFASMCTNEGNSHGMVFDCDGLQVSLSPHISDLARALKPSFLSNKSEESEAIASEIFFDNSAETQKMRFVSWFRTLQHQGRPYNPVTISGYSGRIESACNDNAFCTITPKNLFAITDIAEFRQIKHDIQSCSGYQGFDLKSHKGFTAALNKYEEFLSRTV